MLVGAPMEEMVWKEMPGAAVEAEQAVRRQNSPWLLQAEQVLYPRPPGIIRSPLSALEI